MNPILNNILAAVAGIVIGMILNSALVNLGPTLIPLPEGADVSSMDALKETMHLFKAQNFIFPFLGHALGTLAGAFAAAKIAAAHKMKFAIGVGFFFLLGGISMVMMVPGPVWFNILDLVVAYIPMAWLGGLLAANKKAGR
ncbi:MAG TPA: hypothetical protein ENK52_05085 [Saprospiraceae bacterium]|nr:hypothetical protein [Saprospiraceae bacterium]